MPATETKVTINDLLWALRFHNPFSMIDLSAVAREFFTGGPSELWAKHLDSGAYSLKSGSFAQDQIQNFMGVAFFTETRNFVF